MSKKIKIILVLFLMVSIGASAIALLPEKTVNHNSGAKASELETIESVEGSVTIISYVDEAGEVTDAADLGYATIQKTKNAEGKLVKECYFNAQGDPVKRYNEYYGVAYEYGSNTVKMTYLDKDEMPIVRTGGYSAIVRTLDEDGKAIDDFYYDRNGQLVSCNGYYGIHRDYDVNGQNNRVTYLDASGQPVCGPTGYAIRVYDRDLSGTVTAEHYFDVHNNPATSSLGQYGEQYQRDENGRVIQITYLNADGDPAPNDVGYTILKRTYYHDSTVATDMYFDANGNPMALTKGQYGIKHSGKINLFLNKKGHVMLCVDNVLNGFPVMVVVCGCIICVLMMFLPRKASACLTIAYVVFIFYETLMFREIGDSRTNLILFSYADRFFKEQGVRAGVINNIWLFIPLGVGIDRNIQKRWVLWIPFLLSVAIEVTQYITGLGIAEFDDVFGNTLGGWIGIWVMHMALNWRQQRKSRKFSLPVLTKT